MPDRKPEAAAQSEQLGVSSANMQNSRADRVPMAEAGLESLVQTADQVTHDNEHESASHLPTGVALHWIVF